MAAALHLSLYNNRTFADVTFLFDGNQVRAHKAVLAERCDYFRRFFEQDRRNVFTMNDTSLKIFDELVKYCYLEQIDIVDWSYHDKQRLNELSSAYNYGPLMDIVNRELDKRPEVPLSVDTLNEWYKRSPGEELREWTKNNILNIANYDDCHEYSKDLILFILDTFNEMYDKEMNKYKLRTEQKNVLMWLFRWRNWWNREDEDVESLFLTARLQLVLKKRNLRDKTLQKKSSIETNDGLFLVSDSFAITAKYETAIKDFLIFRKLDTNGWTCDEILQLLGCANEYEFGPLFDAILNVMTTQHLEPSSLIKIYDVARQLKSSKLQQILIDYLRNNINRIFTSAEFTNYPARVVGFIIDNLNGQYIATDTVWLIFPLIKKWMALNSKKDAKIVYKNIKFNDFKEKVDKFKFSPEFPSLTDLEKLPKNYRSKYVRCIMSEHEFKAHKILCDYGCNTFKQLFDPNEEDQINVETTPIQPYNQLIDNCDRQKVDLAGWAYSEKKYLYDLATKCNCQSLIDLVKIELHKRPKVPLSAESLNEWFMNCPAEEIRDWVKNNSLSIVNYEDCHQYSKDLVVLIMDAFGELANMETDKQKLNTSRKKLLLWLFRWRNSSTRTENDVQRVFTKIELPIALKGRALRDKTLQKKLLEAVRQFCHNREVDTAGWTCDDVLELLRVAHDNEFRALVDAVVNVLDTQSLEPASLGKIHHLTSRQVSDKLQQIVADYVRNHSMLTLTSSEFISYPASVVKFILESLIGQVMDVNVKNQLLTSLWNWKTSKSEEELKVVFDRIKWEDFSQQQLVAVLRTVIPATCLVNISSLQEPEVDQGGKRKLSDKFQCKRHSRPRQE